MSEELDEFNINIDDLKVSINLFDNIEEAIQKMKMETLKDRFEVVLNNNLIEFKEKFTNFRTILGCRVSYDNLNKDISFIVREDTKPSYEQLENQLQQKENIIKEVREYVKKNTEEKKSWLNGIPDYTVFKGDAKELLEILDKENK